MGQESLLSIIRLLVGDILGKAGGRPARRQGADTKKHTENAEQNF